MYINESKYYVYNLPSPLETKKTHKVTTGTEAKTLRQSFYKIQLSTKDTAALERHILL